MSFRVHETTVLSLKPGDSGYNLFDGIKLVPRAMIGIKQECPSSIRDTLKLAIDRGWVVPIATIYQHEQTFNVLADKA